MEKIKKKKIIRKTTCAILVLLSIISFSACSLENEPATNFETSTHNSRTIGTNATTTVKETIPSFRKTPITAGTAPETATIENTKPTRVTNPLPTTEQLTTRSLSIPSRTPIQSMTIENENIESTSEPTSII